MSTTRGQAMDDGGSAFPEVETIVGTHRRWDGTEQVYSQVQSIGGMSLRDWFAGQALTQLVDSSRTVDLNPQNAAAYAYEYADAMLAAREQKETL